MNPSIGAIYFTYSVPTPYYIYMYNVYDVISLVFNIFHFKYFLNGIYEKWG